MPKVHRVAVGTFSLTHTTPYTRPAPALALPPRLHSGPRGSKFPTMNLCDSLRVYGCNVNPKTTGTTRGDPYVVARRNTSKFMRLGPAA